MRPQWHRHVHDPLSGSYRDHHEPEQWRWLPTMQLMVLSLLASHHNSNSYLRLVREVPLSLTTSLLPFAVAAREQVSVHDVAG